MRRNISTVLRIRVSKDLHDKLDVLRGDKTLSGYIRDILERHAGDERTAVNYEALRLRELVDSVGRLNEAEKEIKVTLQSLQTSRIWNKGLVQELLFYVAKMNFYMDGFARLQLSKEDLDRLNQYVRERSEKERKNLGRICE